MTSRAMPANPLDLSMLVKDGKHRGMDVAHAAVRPHDAVLLDDRLAPQDALGGLVSALPVLRMNGFDPLDAVLRAACWTGPRPARKPG